MVMAGMLLIIDPLNEHWSEAKLQQQIHLGSSKTLVYTLCNEATYKEKHNWIFQEVKNENMKYASLLNRVLPSPEWSLSFSLHPLLIALWCLLRKVDK